jgi:hypothetical protein
MPQFNARINVTHACIVYVDAKTEKGAREQLKSGDWESVTTLETVDWEEPDTFTEEE